jgi:superkiller protein 3
MLIFAGCAMKSVNMQSAEIYYSQGDYDKAIQYYEAEVAQNPQNAKAYYDLGQCYRMKQNYEKMSEMFYKSIAISQQYFNDIADIREELWVKFYNEGVPLFNDRNYQEAFNSFNSAITVDPENREGYKERGLCYLQLALLEQDSVKKTEMEDKAIADFDKFISLDPEGKDLSVRINRANLFFQNYQYAKAEPAYLEILKYDPNNIGAIYNLASIYQERGESQKAVDMYQKVLQKNPNDPDMWFNLGLLYFQMEQYDKAKESFDKVLSFNPEDVETMMNLVNLLWKVGMEKEAIPYLEKVVKLEANNLKAWQFLFVAYSKAGVITKANEAFKKYKALEAEQKK